jgi:hypothetical protein
LKQSMFFFSENDLDINLLFFYFFLFGGVGLNPH